MSKEYRIDIARWRKQVTKDWNPDERHENQNYIDDLLTLLDELKRCYEIIDSIPEGMLDEPCEGCNTIRIGYYDRNVCEHDRCDMCKKCCTCNSREASE